MSSLFSTSESFASTPGRATVSVLPVVTLYVSPTATGASFTGVTVIVTVATSDSRSPETAR